MVFTIVRGQLMTASKDIRLVDLLEQSGKTYISRISAAQQFPSFPERSMCINEKDPAVHSVYSVEQQILFGHTFHFSTVVP